MTDALTNLNAWIAQRAKNAVARYLEQDNITDLAIASVYEDAIIKNNNLVSQAPTTEHEITAMFDTLYEHYDALERDTSLSPVKRQVYSDISFEVSARKFACKEGVLDK